MAELVYMNNRYHLLLSNCTFCALETDLPDDSSISFDDVLIRASTPLPSSDSALNEVTVPVSNLPLSPLQKDRIKDQAFITRMVKSLTKLEEKYRTPEHKRKRRLFTRN